MFTVKHQVSLSNLVPVAVGAAVGIVALELWKWGRREQSKKVFTHTHTNLGCKIIYISVR